MDEKANKRKEYSSPSKDQWTNILLTPSYHGELCLGSGDDPRWECCCDECAYYLECFPDWEEFCR